MGQPLPKGYTVYPDLPNAQRLDYAKHYINQILFGIKTRPDGFTYDSILWLLENWLMFIKNFRGPGDIGTRKHMYSRRRTPRSVPGGFKRSEHLARSLKILLQFLNPGERNLEGVYKIYQDCDEQFFDLAEAARADLERRKDPALSKYVHGLEVLTDRVKIRQL